MLSWDCLAPLWCTTLQKINGLTLSCHCFCTPLIQLYLEAMSTIKTSWVNVWARGLPSLIPHVTQEALGELPRLHSHTLHHFYFGCTRNGVYGLMLSKHSLYRTTSPALSLKSLLFWDRVSLSFPGKSCICNLPASVSWAAGIIKLLHHFLTLLVFNNYTYLLCMVWYFNMGRYVAIKCNQCIYHQKFRF